MLSNEVNRVTLADDLDQYGLPVARITYAWGDNDKALVNHSLEQMSASIQAIGAKDMFRQEDDTCHLGGTARMGAIRARASSMPTAGAGIFPICGCVTDRYFRPSPNVIT